MLSLIDGEKTRAAFARKVGTDPAYISQILSTKTKAEIGNELARAIEDAYKLPYGWMDTQHGPVKSALTPDQLMLAEAYPSLPPEKKSEWLDRMAQDPARYKALLDALLTEVSQQTIRAVDRRKPTTTPWTGVERRKAKNGDAP